MLAPIRYRKKPPEVEAIRLTPDNAEQVAAWCGGTVDRDGHTVSITVTHSVVRAEVGDYVIRDRDYTGQVSYYPMRRQILDHCYEPVGGSP